MPKHDQQTDARPSGQSAAESVQHTPGPWVARHSDLDSRRIIICADGQGSVPLIAVAEGNPQSESNARLVAAAPDLLAALESLGFAYSGHLGRLLEEQRGYRSEQKRSAMQPRIDSMRSTLARASAVIAKAKGVQS